MSEKGMVVHLPTQELWDKVCPGVGLPSKTWGTYKTESCIRISTKTYGNRAYYSDGNPLIITAEEYLKEVKDEVIFQVWDRVECVDEDDLPSGLDLRLGYIYVIKELHGGQIKLEGFEDKFSPWKKRFKLLTNKPTTTKEETVASGWARGYWGKGRTCDHAADALIYGLGMAQVNIKGFFKEEAMSKDNNVNPDVQAVFGEEVNGNELLVIDRHFTNPML